MAEESTVFWRISRHLLEMLPGFYCYFPPFFDFFFPLQECYLFIFLFFFFFFNNTSLNHCINAPRFSINVFFFVFFWRHDWGDLNIFPPFEYMIYLTRSKTCIGKHISLFSPRSWRTLTWKVKNDPQGPLTDPTGPGGGTPARFKRLRLEMRSFHGSLGLSTPHTPPPDRQPRPETFKRQKRLPSVKNEKAFIENYWKREGILSTSKKRFLSWVSNTTWL